MNNSYLVSIIVPVYNAEKFITETIASVQKQTYQNWEHLIVIDNNSKDRTESLVRAIEKQDSRVKCIRAADAFGSAGNRNVGIREAKGELLAFLDADDLWAPEKLCKQIEFMQKHHSDFSVTAFQRVSEDGKSLGKILEVPGTFNKRDILFDNFIGCLTVLLRKKAFHDLKFVDLGWEDMSLWLECLSQIKEGHGLNEVLAYYRIVPGSRSHNKAFAAKLRWGTLRQAEKMSWPVAAYYFACYGVTGVRKHFRF